MLGKKLHMIERGVAGDMEAVTQQLQNSKIQKIVGGQRFIATGDTTSRC